MLRTLCALLLGVVLAVAPPAAAQVGPARGASERSAARADRPFRLGVVGGDRREATLRRIEPFRAHLASILDRPVAAFAFDGEAEVVGALVGERIDYAPLSAIGYATAARLCDCVEPLAAPRDADRAAGWHTVILAPVGRGLSRLGDLAGRRLAISRDPAIGTRRLALMFLARAGLTGATAPVLVETDGPEAALAAALDGRADAAVAWSSLAGDPQEGWSRGTLADMVARGAVRAEQVTVVWSSPPLPLGPHTVRASTDEATKRRLREMLIDLDVDPDVYEAVERAHPGGFARVGAPAYRPFVDLLTPAEEPTDPAPTGAAPPKG